MIRNTFGQVKEWERTLPIDARPLQRTRSLGDSHQRDTVFPEILREGIWHTTSVERFEGILAAGGILPEPRIPDMDRWGTGCGPSLYPLSMWQTFVPCFSKWDESIWIELDRSAIKDSFVDGKAVIERWKKQNELGRTIMPVIEAAHIGPVPISAFRRVYKYNKHDQEFKQIQIPRTQASIESVAPG